MTDPDDAFEFEDDEEEDLCARVISEGEVVCRQDWDSGGPGAGAGRVSVYLLDGQYYVINDAGLSAPYPSKEKAAAENGVMSINDATESIWDKDLGYIYSRD